MNSWCASVGGAAGAVLVSLPLVRSPPKARESVHLTSGALYEFCPEGEENTVLFKAIFLYRLLPEVKV
jgi:hypothetical protein